MKRTIHPMNVAEGDVVEFMNDEFFTKTNTPLPAGTKASFLEWIDIDGVDCALASVTPIDVDPPTRGWIWVDPNSLCVEERD